MVICLDDAEVWRGESKEVRARVFTCIVNYVLCTAVDRRTGCRH